MPAGYEWNVLIDIGLAVVLSLLIGVERAYYQKAAGIRTHTLVGLGAATFTIVSKYGFLSDGLVGGDGSRVAAQIVSGIGFLGAGLIFVHRGSVRGLTTAASVWMVAAVGMACGAGMWAVGAIVTAVYLGVTVGIRPLARRMPHAHSRHRTIDVAYDDGKGILRTIMELMGTLGIQVTNLAIRGSATGVAKQPVQRVAIDVEGAPAALTEAVSSIKDVPGVRSVSSQEQDDE